MTQAPQWYNEQVSMQIKLGDIDAYLLGREAHQTASLIATLPLLVRHQQGQGSQHID